MEPSANKSPCEDLLLFKQGLDFRLTEFLEQQRRILQTHDLLTQKCDELESKRLIAQSANSEASANAGSLTSQASKSNPVRQLLKNQTKELKEVSQTLIKERQDKQVLQDEIKRLRNWFSTLPLRDGRDTGGFADPFSVNDPAMLHQRGRSGSNGRRKGRGGNQSRSSSASKKRGVNDRRMMSSPGRGRPGERGSGNRNVSFDDQVENVKDENLLPAFLRSPSQVPLPKTPMDENL
ncbi:unnamed protein product [Amoebophrya sp. A120]|nr:unnamed protein product [Amoebophrya sp. A120]|eukprot:GSA120T00024494001.1